MPTYPSPTFPAIGSTIGPSNEYFCLGRLGRGTFCSIHKCIDLSSPPPKRLVAAKVELETFTNSGVLDGEAMILRHLSKTMPKHMVPEFYAHVKQPTGKGITAVSAIIMEYLRGEDMHLLRDKFCAGSGGGMRRVSTKDAVYLTADCMLPLLLAMHSVGVIHRDVKPSNCVRVGTSDDNRRFKIVDFGLSKSFVVPKSSPLANPNLLWKGEWCVPPDGETSPGCMRQERPRADFRGTSMYASLRVHQGKDYAPRDDVWSLMYVFCDLVSGGLPWMAQAASRDREACQRMKERVHGDDGVGNDHLELLLMGADYHLGKKGSSLDMAKDQKKVSFLKTAFQHLGQLKFADKVDYVLIEGCLRGFMEGSMEEKVPSINWDTAVKQEKTDSKKKKKKLSERWDEDQYQETADDDKKKPADHYADWFLPNQPDISSSILEEAEQEYISSQNTNTNTPSNDNPLPTSDNSDPGRYHVSLQMRLAQVEYNARNSNRVPMHLALKEWMSLATYLTKEQWDINRYERGNHRVTNDGYRREEFIKVVRRCFDAAKPFGYFTSREYFGFGDEEYRQERFQLLKKEQLKDEERKEKRPRLLFVAHIKHDLKCKLEEEEEKTFAPPPSISFKG